MIRYSQQMCDVKYNILKKRKGRAKKTHKYCLDIMTFDIEVSSSWMIDGKLRGYHPGEDADYWNDKDKFSLPYIWQFSFNETVYYGRNIYEFLNLLDDIPKDYECIIWIHNLAYEYHAALINIMTVKKTFARSPHSPIYAVFEEYPNITFRCSYTLTNLSLDKWGKQLGIEKLSGTLDYNTLYPRTPYTPLFDFEYDYAERDCIVLYHGIKDHLKTYKNVFDIPLTSTGKVRRVVKDILVNDKAYMKEIKRLVPRDKDEYLRFQSVFAGGYTHGNRKYVNKLIDDCVIEHRDISSSYPTAMFAYKYPYNKWAYIGAIMPDPGTFEYRAYIVRLHMTNVKCKTWNTYISSSKCRGRGILGDNGRVLKADDLYLCVTEQDLDIILRSYSFDSIESEGTWVCQKRYLPTIFVDYILKLYEAKTALKGIESEADRYAISKTYINSLYGMSVTNIIQSSVIFTDDCEWIVEELTADMIDYKLNKMKRWFDKSYFLSYPAGCWITAYARHRLWDCILKIDNDLIYTDTDSVFYKGHKDWQWFNDDIDKRIFDACQYHEIPFSKTRPKDKDGIEWPLGYLTEEPDCIAFKTLGAKKYIEKRTVKDKKTGIESDKLFMTISGINKGAVEVLNGDINEFKDGKVFDKDHESVHKNEITYLSDMPRVVYPDGFVSDLKFGINMRPTGYKLSVPKVIDSLEVLINNVVNPIEQEIIRKRGTLIE